MLTKQEKVDQIKEFFGKTRMDKEVNKLTLGKEFDHINPELMLAASHKLVQINKGEIEPDDRDNLMYSKFHGLEDTLAQHIRLDAGKYQAKAKMKMDQKKNLSGIDAGFFSGQLRSAIVGNTLAQIADGGNPLEPANVASKVTKYGEGGIASESATPDSTRQISDSHFGLFDVLQLSEDNKIGVTTYISHGTRKGNDGKLYKLVLDKNDKPVWISHEQLLSSKIEIPEN